MEEINSLLVEERFDESKIALEKMIGSNPSPENYSLLIKSIIGLENFDEMEQFIKTIPKEISKCINILKMSSLFFLMEN